MRVYWKNGFHPFRGFVAVNGDEFDPPKKMVEVPDLKRGLIDDHAHGTRRSGLYEAPVNATGVVGHYDCGTCLGYILQADSVNAVV